MKLLSIFMISLLLVSLVLIPGIYAQDDTDTINSNNNEEEVDSVMDDLQGVVVLADEDKNDTGLNRAIDATTERADRAKRVLEILRECEKKDTRRERIACRLRVSDRQEHEEETRIPEVCKRLDSVEDCRKLHRAANHCYAMDNGRLKAKCFMRVSGFVQSKIHYEENDRPEKTRNYIVHLLTELQGRIEQKVDSGDLDAEVGADLIEQIIEIKEDILNGETRDVIKPKLQAFKQSFREAMQ